MLKRNQGEVVEAVALALESERGEEAPDVVTYDKKHGRLEIREYWWLPVDEELRHYPATEYRRPAVRRCGRVRRSYRLLHEKEWHEEEHLWLYQARVELEVTPERLSRWVRGHWGDREQGLLGARCDIWGGSGSRTADRDAAPHFAQCGAQSDTAARLSIYS